MWTSRASEISNRNFEKEMIELPADDKGNPDWQYMENYIRELEKKVKFQAICNDSISPSMEMNNICEWEYFKLSELFDMYKGQELAQSDDNGEIELVSATRYNNGVCGKKNIGSKLFPAGSITVSSNGYVGEAFYHESCFYATGDVNILEIKDEYKDFYNMYNAFFLITIIKQERYKYGYGRKWGINRMKQSEIKLPAIKNAQNKIIPDWKFMESYIKSLPYTKNFL